MYLIERDEKDAHNGRSGQEDEPEAARILVNAILLITRGLRINNGLRRFLVGHRDTLRRWRRSLCAGLRLLVGIGRRVVGLRSHVFCQ